MKRLALYEPAMDCPTGLCGVDPDPELVRIFAVLTRLKKRGIDVQRFNYAQDPIAFMTTESILMFLASQGEGGLPIALLDDEIVLSGRYPTNAELTTWFDLPPGILEADADLSTP